MRQSLLAVMSKAMDALKGGITISDAAKPDCPLIYTNKGFLKMTGYTYKEVIGRNCRFLQGIDTDKRTIKKIHNAIQNNKPVEVQILNYTKKGNAFWNNLSILPIFNKEGDIIYFVGLQEKITTQKDILFKQIAQTAIQIQEEEKENIGKQLHDNVSQLLATCKLYLNLAKTEEDIRMPMIQQTIAVIDMAIKELGNLSRALVKPNFEEDSLNESIENLIENLQYKASFSITYTCKNVNEKKLSATKKLLLFRAVQEWLNSLIKHTKARNVIINIAEQRQQIQLSIEDDGNGSDAQRILKGTGLKAINNRIAIESGTMQLNYASGTGCEIKIILPL